MTYRFCFLSLIALLTFGIVATASQAQILHGDWCGTEEEFDPQTLTAGVEIPTEGEFRALAIFVRFKDDTTTAGCSQGYSLWPTNELMPELGDYLLAESSTPPFPDSSLTQYFHLLSDGHFTLYGSSFGYITQHNEQDYTRLGTTATLDREALTEEILDSFDSLIDYSDYDANNDGYIDHIFIIIRGFNNLHLGGSSWSGVSSLVFEHLTPTSQYDGMLISSQLSGSYNIYQRVDVTRNNINLLAHEFGHDLWNYNQYIAGHTAPIVGNWVPYVPPPHVDPTDHGYADRMQGYTLMQGDGGASQRLRNIHATAAERWLINSDNPQGARWITCTPPTHGTAISLQGPDIVTGECIEILFDEDGDDSNRLLVSRMSNNHLFTEDRLLPSSINQDCPGCHTIDANIIINGLMIELLNHTPNDSPFSRRDLVPPDNALERLAACSLAVGIGPSVAEFYKDDMWRPDNARQLSPWTRPNVYGHTFGADVPSSYFDSGWHVLDDFRYNMLHGGIEFDYYESPFALDTFYVRQDSWMDSASDDVEFFGHVRVLEGATLHIDSIYVAFHAGLSVEDGGLLAVNQANPNAPEARLAFGLKTSLDIEGEFVGSSLRLDAIHSSEPWAGIALLRGEMNLEDATITEAEVGLFISSNKDSICTRCTIVESWTGVRTDYIFEDISASRGRLLLLQSAINDNYGVGVEVRNANVELQETTIQNNSKQGITIWNSTVDARSHNSIVENGYLSLYDGVSVLDNGELNLSWLFIGRGENSVSNNAFHQIVFDSESSFGFIGMSEFTGHNAIFAEQPAQGAQLIVYRQETPPLQARYTYWGDPDGPPAGSLDRNVEYIPWLQEDPTTSSRPVAAAGMTPNMPIALDDGGAFGGVASRTALELDWLLQAILDARVTALNTEASDAVDGVGALYALQRLDREDELGEYAASMAVIRTLRQDLDHAAERSPHRRAAEAALLAEVHEALRLDEYDQAAELLAFTGTIEQEAVARSLDLARVMVYERSGHLTEALETLLEVIDGLDADAHRMVRDLSDVAAIIEWKLDGGMTAGRGAAPSVRPVVEGRQDEPSLALGTPFPNPVRDQAQLSLVVPETADVRVAVYDMLGRRVQVLQSGSMTAGVHAVTVDTRLLAAGTYVVRAEVDSAAGREILSQRLTVID